MAYLNSDDGLLPGSLDYVAHVFAANPDVDVIYGHRICIDETGWEIGRWILPQHDAEIIKWFDLRPAGNHVLAAPRLGSGGSLRRKLRLRA